MAYITSYSPMPISFSHGKGIWLYDENNKPYFDALTGIAVCGLGHAHPEVTKTIQEQAARLIHTSNAYHIKEQEALAEKLAKKTGMDQAFFANSGAEANEAAIKLSRLYGHQKGIETPSVIVMEKAFHGRTMATLTASGNRKVQAGFEPLVPGFIRAPFNDINAIKTIASNRNDIVAVMVEPIQGEGGIYPAEKNYLQALAELCDKNDWLFILDEIQTGNGRTGELYAFMHYGVQPDIFTTAKGLGNGMPIGACMMRNRAKDLFKPGNHGSTFGGNPLACATASTVLDVIENERLCEKVRKNAPYLRQKLIDALKDNTAVKEIRGLGYMIGIEIDRPATKMRDLGLENGILFTVSGDTTIRILPPLIMEKADIDELVARLSKTIHEYTASNTTSTVV